MEKCSGCLTLCNDCKEVHQKDWNPSSLKKHPSEPMYEDDFDKPIDNENLRELLSDPVNRPSHYTRYEGFEVIDITKQMDFLTGNAIKYILRAPFKENEKQDLEKAIWYLNKKLEQL